MPVPGEHGWKKYNGNSFIMIIRHLLWPQAGAFLVALEQQQAFVGLFCSSPSNSLQFLFLGPSTFPSKQLEAASPDCPKVPSLLPCLFQKAGQATSTKLPPSDPPSPPLPSFTLTSIFVCLAFQAVSIGHTASLLFLAKDPHFNTSLTSTHTPISHYQLKKLTLVRNLLFCPSPNFYEPQVGITGVVVQAIQKIQLEDMIVPPLIQGQ